MHFSGKYRIRLISSLKKSDSRISTISENMPEDMALFVKVYHFIHQVQALNDTTCYLHCPQGTLLDFLLVGRLVGWLVRSLIGFDTQPSIANSYDER